MIRVILFDFDGVIVDSVNIKTDAFRDLFLNERKYHLDAILEYHRIHGGVSRVKKIEYFYKNILHRDLKRETLKILTNRFSRLVKDKVLNAPFIEGAFEFLNENYTKFRLHVISGTPEEELKDIITKRNLNPFFVDVNGSPPGKATLISLVIKRYGYLQEEVLYVGDSPDDAQSASAAGVQFIRLCDKKYIDDFRDDSRFSTITDYRALENLINGARV